MHISHLCFDKVETVGLPVAKHGHDVGNEAIGCILEGEFGARLVRELVSFSVEGSGIELVVGSDEATSVDVVLPIVVKEPPVSVGIGRESDNVNELLVIAIVLDLVTVKNELVELGTCGAAQSLEVESGALRLQHVELGEIDVFRGIDQS